MHKSILSLGGASGVVKVWDSFRAKLHFRKWHVFQDACRHIVEQKSLHCNFDEMPNVRLELVAD